jgi:hypothetical protein
MRFSDQEPVLHFSSFEFELASLQEIWQYWADVDQSLPMSTHFTTLGEIVGIVQ